MYYPTLGETFCGAHINFGTTIHGVGMRRVKLPGIFTLFSSTSRSFPCSNRRFWLTVLVVARFSSNRSLADSYLINSVRYAPRPRPHLSESSATMRLHVSQLSLQLPPHCIRLSELSCTYRMRPTHPFICNTTTLFCLGTKILLTRAMFAFVQI